MAPFRKREQFRKPCVEPLERRDLLAADVVVSEFMPDNESGIVDSFGETADWIELFNTSDRAVRLDGWHLTDDPQAPTKWTFPSATELSPQSYLVVFASGRDQITNTGELHTNFKLSASGEYLSLQSPAGIVATSYGDADTNYDSVPSDVSLGLDVDGRQRFFMQATPGLPNDFDGGGLVADTKFSTDRGFYTQPFSLTIRSATDQATLVYTLDGSEPTMSNGISVSVPTGSPSATLTIDTTTTVRAMAYRDGWSSTNVDTHTYLFPADVIRQSGVGLPNTWGHAGADYAMDPRIVDSAPYSDVILEGLQSIPSVSLVTHIDQFFDRQTGIYPSGQNSPRVVSMEVLYPDGLYSDGLYSDGLPNVQTEASVEIAGGSSTGRWKSDKLSMQLKFKKEFGDAKLDHPLFGENAAQRFDTLTLDARLNQAWHYGGGVSPTSQRERAQFARDQYVADLQRAMGGLSPHGQWVHLYLNGIYWGMYNLHERPDEHFAQDYRGGEKADYDVIKHNTDVVAGSYDAYQTLLNTVAQNVRLADRYAAVESILDVDDFISYILVNYYVGNTDWGHHNWYASRNATSGDGKWKFHSWDAEHTLKTVNDDPTGRGDARGPTGIHQRLMQNPEYRLKFMDQVQQAVVQTEGPLSPAKAAERYRNSLDEIRDAVVPESARWGDNRRDTPYTRDIEWDAESTRLLNDYFPDRSNRLVELLRNRGFFHDYDAPTLELTAPLAGNGYLATLRTSDGTVYFTTDGSDPRNSPAANVYSSPFHVAPSNTLRLRTLRGESEWSAMSVYDVGQQGDFSGNGTLDAADIDLLLQAINQPTEEDARFDLDGNQAVDSMDVDVWLHELANARRGDANLDGEVSFADFLTLSSNFGSVTSGGWAAGDFDGDQDVDFADFLALSAQFGLNRDALD